MDEIEQRIKEQVKKKLFFPLLRVVQQPKDTLKNSFDDEGVLWEALQTGKITFNRGTFSGKFDARTTRALKSLGATWDRGESTFKLGLREMPLSIQQMVTTTQNRFEKRLAAVDIELAKIVPEEIVAGLRLTDLFDKTVFKVDKDFRHNVKSITLEPEVSASARAKIAKEWEDNLKLKIVDFSRDQIKELRARVEKTFYAGNRYGTLVEEIQKSYGGSAAHAKFLARQESKLLTAKYAETRYIDADVPKYIWRTVVGSPKHPVRPDHKLLEGTVQEWANPPISNQKTKATNNPGQDYGCRCRAVPVVEFKR